MILESLTLHDFCLFRDRQTFNLAPINGEQPVILIGGLNGAGKTTILDAVQLALYGPRAQLSKREGVPYEVYLRQCIHRGADPKGGASVALRFRYVAEGEEHQYEVRRSWKEKRKHIAETVSVSKDGEHDEHLSEHWSEIVEEIIPLGISRLFFFDAEQVRFLADDESSNQTLGTAVKSLLGLDLAEKLIADASVLENRLSERIASISDDPKYAGLLKKLSAKDKELKAKKDELAALENSRQRAVEAKRLAEVQFKELGGDHWMQREARRQELVQSKEAERQTSQDLVRLASTELPFALTPDLVRNVDERDLAEQSSREASVVIEVLVKRDSEVLKTLRSEGVDDDTIALVRRIQEADRDARKKTVASGFGHGLSEASRAAVRHLRNGALSGQIENVTSLLERFDKARTKCEQLERSLEMTPDDISIVDVFDRLRAATEKESILNGQAGRIQDEINSLRYQRDEIERIVKTIQRKQVDAEIDSDQAARMVKLAVRTQETMREFLKRATARKIDRLSHLISEAFQFLLRKQILVERIEIDPDSFRITLFDSEGGELPKERLSEGEKQIFAVSVLWGLAKASPRPLPAIIDTPMARLDSEHRTLLVERYLPHASHQVIVLSTDAEIDQTFYPKLSPFVSREFHLSYDEDEKMTVVEDGYFPAFKNQTVVSAK